MPAEDNANAKALLDRIVAMLTKLGQRGYAVHETPTGQGADRIDTDSDPRHRRNQ
jgi:PII-like signaling protein